TAGELAPFYEKAAKFCRLPESDFSAKFWKDKLGGEIADLNKSFDVAMYQFLNEDNKKFAIREFEDTTIAQSIDVILNASLLEIVHANGTVSSLTVASMDDQPKPRKAKTITIKAKKAYILACGAVENARQLLLSDICNEHDQVGRYFM